MEVNKSCSYVVQATARQPDLALMLFPPVYRKQVMLSLCYGFSICKMVIVIVHILQLIVTVAVRKEVNTMASTCLVL